MTCPMRFPSPDSRGAALTAGENIADTERRLPDLDESASDDADVLVSDTAAATITHRRGQTRFLEPQDERDGGPRSSRATASLCRLAFDLAKAPNPQSLAEEALSGLFANLRVDGGAVLALPREESNKAKSTILEIIASRTETELPYHRLSAFLADTVLREGEALLARNVSGDSILGSRDATGLVRATSVICAPIRHAQTPLGLVHLYSTNPEVELDPDDLEFTLAVAETVGVALENLSRRAELAENLNRVRDENIQLRERLGVESEMVGSSLVVAGITQEIARAAPSRATVLCARRERRGQGAGRPGSAFLQPAAQGSIRLFELRRPVAKPARQ